MPGTAFWVKTLIIILVSAAVLILAAVSFGPVFVYGFILLTVLAETAFLVAVIWSLVSGAPFVPIDRRRAEAMVRVAGLQPGELAVDLGSGDGRVLIIAAKSGARAEGWEINPGLWLMSVISAQCCGLGQRVKVHLRSYWGDDVARADVVFLFLIRHRMAAMSAKLRRELRPGSRVVSYGWRLPDWPGGGEAVGDGLYLYRQS